VGVKSVQGTKGFRIARSAEIKFFAYSGDMMKEKKCKCGHEKRFHAIKEKHVLGTSHCTADTCQCKEYVEADDGKKDDT